MPSRSRPRPLVASGFVAVKDTASFTNKLAGPATISAQVQAVKETLRAARLRSLNQIAARFKQASRTRIAEILETLTASGQTRESEERYSL